MGPINHRQETGWIPDIAQQGPDVAILIWPESFRPSETIDNKYMATLQQALDKLGIEYGDLKQSAELERVFEAINQRAKEQHDEMFSLLTALDVPTVSLKGKSVEDVKEPLPDEVFPNNWFSIHIGEDRRLKVVIYPMRWDNRRKEVREDLIQAFREIDGVDVIDMRPRNEVSEKPDAKILEGKYLEGTGSLVLDHENRTAYVALSQRSNPELVEKWAKELGYKVVTFNAVDKERPIDDEPSPIYHTNVMMHVGSTCAVVCLNSIIDPIERQAVAANLKVDGKEVIDITLGQMRAFGGNMLELKNRKNQKMLMLSDTAFQELRKDDHGQNVLERLKHHYAYMIHAPADVIEINGGSTRCMIARCVSWVKEKQQEIFQKLSDLKASRKLPGAAELPALTLEGVVADVETGKALVLDGFFNIDPKLAKYVTAGYLREAS